VRDLQRDVVKHLAVIERLRHMFEPDCLPAGALAKGGLIHALTGKTKKISFTSTTLMRMMQIDDSTTLLVDVRPTPSVPCVVLKPRYDATVPMMKPKTAVLKVAGTKSVNSMNEKARWKYSCADIPLIEASAT